ncbi:MAG: low specificity L-threonine aldolase, partial [Clostridia bacterium]|nr:low specificity L-threonine aldolase [Clostridia bacterium]
MLSFECDYNVGAHLLILQRLIETNLEAQPGYGEDAYTASAKAKIKAACGRDHLDVHFLAGGTQTNKIVIDSMLHPVEGV